MAERRMFAKTIIDSDAFLEMPLSTQALYFHLSMRADDDGFINNPKKIQRMVGASEDEMKVLITKKFIIPFESGIVVIKHWKIHNYIRNDRYKETVYIKEKSMLSIKDNGVYTQMDTIGIPNDNQVVDKWDTQVSIGKDSIGKDSIVDKIDKIDKIDISGKPPVTFLKEMPSNFTRELIEAKYILADDVHMEQFNNLFIDLIHDYGIEIVRSCLFYFIKQYKEQDMVDGNGDIIENKFAYFKVSMVDGAKGLYRRG